MNQVSIGGGLLPELLHTILYSRPSNILQSGVSNHTRVGESEKNINSNDESMI